MAENESRAVWPGWETVRLIGRGSFGAVYEIQRDVFGHKEKAALKLITIPQSESDIDDLLSDGYDEESITTRFEGYLHDIVREYSMMADMKGCANIVYCDDVKYVQHDNGMGWDIYIKMELLTALPRAVGRKVTDEQVVKIGTDICSALAFCEKRNLLHRDIKPQNIFVAPDGTYKLGDFGIAKTAERTTSGTKTGTYKYMAPEVYNNRPYGGKADIYSLGLVLYWLLNERRTPFLPLPPTTPKSTEEDAARARRFNGEEIPAPAHGSPELQRIVLKACAYEPADRYQNAEEMLRDLEGLDAAANPLEEPKKAKESAASEVWDAQDETVPVKLKKTEQEATVVSLRKPAPVNLHKEAAPQKEEADGNAGAFAPSEPVNPASGRVKAAEKAENKTNSSPDGKYTIQEKKASDSSRKKGFPFGILAAILVFAVMITAVLLPKNGGNSNWKGLVPGTASEGRRNHGSSYDIVVWVPDQAVDLTRQQIADFNASNEYGINFNATVESVSEANASDNMATDVEAGGDIFFFAQDQFARLVQAGALNKLGAEAAAAVKSANDAGAVKAATSGEEMFAYPLTADNGYFMYYDKSVIPEEDVDSLEKLVADCEAAGKYFAFETNTSAWYIASWFFATGCVSEWITDNDGKFISIKDTFNSPEGLIAAKGLKKLVDSPMHLSASSASEFSSGAAIVVSGTWDYETAKSILGDNLGVTDLPSFNVNGKDYHLGSFNGCKLLGVKPQADAEKGAALHLLAQYLTGEKAQMERFNALSWGPSNLADQASPAVQANPGLAALLKQAPYSVPQGNIEGSWWDIAKTIGDDVKAARDEAGLQAALDNYAAKIDAVFTRTEEDLAAWSVIGTFQNTYWDTDFPMTAVSGEKDVFESQALELKAGDELKVRRGASWVVNYGADGRQDGPNLVVPKTGTYRVLLLLNPNGSGIIYLELLQSHSETIITADVTELQLDQGASQDVFLTLSRGLAQNEELWYFWVGSPEAEWIDWGSNYLHGPIRITGKGTGYGVVSIAIIDKERGATIDQLDLLVYVR